MHLIDSRKNPKNIFATTINTTRSNSYKINGNPTQVNENSLENSVSIYPNPTNGEFTVYGLSSETELSVYNVFGEKVFTKIVNSKQKTVNLNAARGVYYLKLISDKGTINRKIVME